MAYTIITVSAGEIDLYTVDTLGPGPLAGLTTGPTTRGFTNYPGEVLTGWDPFLGAGSFMFARAGGAITAGNVCELGVNVTNGRYDENMVAWAGTANSGKPLGVAMVTLASGQFGWFQVEGNAVVTVSGAPAVNNPVYWQASGVVSPTAVNGKHMLQSVFVSAAGAVIGSGSQSLVAWTPGAAAGTLSATQAVLSLNSPFAQGQIV